MRGQSLLCRSDAERGRLLDISRRLRGAERAASVLLGIALAIGLPHFGLLCAIPIVAAGAIFWVGQSRLDYVRRPEYLLFALFLIAQVLFGLATIIAGGHHEYLINLLILPTLLVAVAFPARAAAIGAVVTVVLMGLTAWIGFPSLLHHAPFSLFYAAMIAVAASIPAAAARDIDAATRQTAVVDRLTGLLNRVALEARVAEVVHQSSLSAHAVAVVIGDIDHFKQINDVRGHATGDAVLAEIAARLTATMGNEPVYRLGGEEFLVLLADADATAASQTAERLRAAVAASPINGLQVTMSLGVAASPAGETVDYEGTFAAADGALYRSKRDGRNRVSVADGPMHHAPDNVIAFDRRRRHEAPAAVTVAPVPARSPRDRAAEERAQSGSWLVHDNVQREHLLELNRRVHQTNRPAYLVTFGVVLLAAPTYGWVTIIAPFAAAVVYNVVEHLLDRMRRPEYALGAMWLLTQAANAVGAAVVGFSATPDPVYSVMCLVIMMAGTMAIYPRRGAYIGIPFVALAGLGACLFCNPTLVLHNPELIALTMAMVACAGLIGVAAGRSAVDHRGAAVVDQLTGMLNRGAMEARVAELAHQASRIGQQVAVIVGDLDHFKQVNDVHGHHTGDAVLQEAAYRIRKSLRAFESAYRVGGEEFVVLLPGVSPDEATDVAQRICAALHEEPIAGLQVTMSLGVGASASDEFDFPEVFRIADAALYEAKHAGRDCVRCGETAAALAA